MNIYKLGKFLLNKYPLSQQEKWDYSGWIFKSYTRRTKNIVVCLDINNEVVDYAIENNAQLIISHHPHIFSSFKDHISSTYNRKLYRKIKINNITLLSLHTNFDNDSEGMARILKDKLSFKSTIESPMVLFKSKVNLEATAAQLKDDLELSHVEVIKNNEDTKIKGVIIGGGAGGMVETISSTDANTFVTGDFKWNELIVAKDLGLNIIIISHGVEKLFINHISSMVQTQFPNLKVLKFFSEVKRKII